MKCASASSRVYSCSVDGTVLEWNVSTLRVTSRLQLPSGGLSSIRLHGGCVWCCESPVLPPALALGKTGQDEHAAVCFTHFQLLSSKPAVSQSSGPCPLFRVPWLRTPPWARLPHS